MENKEAWPCFQNIKSLMEGKGLEMKEQAGNKR